MGYSVGIRCGNKKMRDRMYEFLCKNFTREPALFYDGKGDSYIRICEPGDDKTSGMSYDHAIDGLGFDYSALGIVERYYLYSVVRWLAITIGNQAIWPQYKLKNPHSYYVYDGLERTVVVINGFEEVSEDFVHHGVEVTTEEGFVPFKEYDILAAREKLVAELKKELGDFETIVHNELKRLRSLWHLQLGKDLRATNIFLDKEAP